MNGRIWPEFSKMHLLGGSKIRLRATSCICSDHTLWMLLCYADVFSGRGDHYGKSEYEAAS